MTTVVDHQLAVDVDGAVRAFALEVVGEGPVSERTVGGVGVGTSTEYAIGVWAQLPSKMPSRSPQRIIPWMHPAVVWWINTRMLSFAAFVKRLQNFVWSMWAPVAPE